MLPDDRAHHDPQQRDPTGLVDEGQPSIRALLLDLDGVVYRGNTALPGAANAISLLGGLGIRHVFVTNNATLTPQEFAEKLGAMGVAAKPVDIITSSEATAEYLLTIARPGATVLVVGEDGLRNALTSRGFRLTDEQPEYVVMGLDRHVTYERLAIACFAIQRGAQLIATNADHFLPVEAGRAPGAGAILAAIVTTTGATPTIVGKPQPTLLRVALDRIGASASEAAIVGDQIESDIRAGRAAGVATIYVTDQPSGPYADIVPDYTYRSLAEVVDCLSRGGLDADHANRAQRSGL